MNFEQLLKKAKDQEPEAKELLYEMFRPLLIHLKKALLQQLFI